MLKNQLHQSPNALYTHPEKTVHAKTQQSTNPKAQRTSLPIKVEKGQRHLAQRVKHGTALRVTELTPRDRIRVRIEVVGRLLSDLARPQVEAQQRPLMRV